MPQSGISIGGRGPIRPATAPAPPHIDLFVRPGLFACRLHGRPRADVRNQIWNYFNSSLRDSEGRTLMVNLQVNGQARSFDGDPSMPLMWFLRDALGLTGTKFGCGIAACGACTVHLNGEAVRSCGVIMSDVAGKNVVTIEGLDPRGEHPVQVAWRNVGVPQCGYCQTGQIMQAAALLKQKP